MRTSIYFRLRHATAVALICAFSGAGAPASAQVYTWFDISGSIGFSEIYELSTGTFMARNNDLLVKSTDGSDTWQNFARPGGPILDFTARGEMSILKLFFQEVLLSNQYWRSTNDGATWQRFSAEGFQTNHTFLMIDKGGEVHGIYVRSNRAAIDKFSRQDSAWRQVGNLSGALLLYNIPSFTAAAIDDDYNFYIGTGTDGIHSSRDSGVTWTEALPYRYVTAICTDPAGDVAIGTLPNGRTAGGVFTTPDGGLTWTLIGLTDMEITSLGRDKTGRLYAVTPDGTYRHLGSDDWEQVGSVRDVYSYFVKSSDGRLMVTADGSGIGRSSDDGTTWTSDALRGREVYAVASAPDGSLLAGTLGSGMFKSRNDGATWQTVGLEIPSAVIHELGGAGGAIAASTPDGLYISGDNGENWTDASAGQPFNVVNTFTTDGVGAWYAGTPAGVYRSTNAGGAWEFTGLGGEPIEQLTTGPDGSVYALSGTTGVYRLSGGGGPWTSLNLEVSGLRTIAVSSAGFIFVGGYAMIYRSMDGGASWDQTSVSFGYVETLIFNGQHNLVAGTTTGAYVSYTSGVTWDYAGLSGVVTCFAFDQAHRLVAGVYEGGVFRTFQVITAAENESDLPDEFRLRNNYPNPFNPTTSIRFELPSAATVDLRVFDVVGREVAPLVSGQLPAGTHETTWDAAGLPSGVYYARMRYEAERDGRAGQPGSAESSGELVRKMLLVR